MMSGLLIKILIIIGTVLFIIIPIIAIILLSTYIYFGVISEKYLHKANTIYNILMKFLKFSLVIYAISAMACIILGILFLSNFIINL